jgi:hypothetical protein
MTEAVDFKKIHTRKYKVWKILSVSPHLSQFYKERESRLRDYRSAIIFPEQILGVVDTPVYHVTCSSPESSIGVGIRAVREFHLTSTKDGVLETIQDVKAWEDFVGEVSDLYLSTGPHNKHAFLMMDLFANRKDAIKFASRYLEKFNG